MNIKKSLIKYQYLGNGFAIGFANDRKRWGPGVVVIRLLVIPNGRAFPVVVADQVVTGVADVLGVAVQRRQVTHL